MRQWFMNTKKGKWHLTLWCWVQVLQAERKQVLSSSYRISQVGNEAPARPSF